MYPMFRYIKFQFPLQVTTGHDLFTSISSATKRVCSNAHAYKLVKDVPELPEPVWDILFEIFLSWFLRRFTTVCNNAFVVSSWSRTSVGLTFSLSSFLTFDCTDETVVFFLFLSLGLNVLTLDTGYLGVAIVA